MATAAFAVWVRWPRSLEAGIAVAAAALAGIWLPLIWARYRAYRRDAWLDEHAWRGLARLVRRRAAQT